MYLQCQEINQASCDIARRCSDKWGTIVAGGIVQTAAYKDGLSKDEVHKELRRSAKLLIVNCNYPALNRYQISDVTL